ncbi:protein phosphatase 1 regulatory subunit 15B [Megalops cyprinoides]|uniref:protein phosphatase 1 regulatory subunit 15B n=1 Tax=Megalops cyprinoides TaxID=118141 RepID=UPI00186499F3|nr:protein phosphatase 1 regulatory subunit 15B [Megalops cyprinoides]
MDTIMRSPERTSVKTAVQRSEDSTTLILPWTRQILNILWEHLQLLVHVVYYSFMAVFQMFRLEVHVRITDETGHHHVQHVSTAGNPAESFILTSLFDSNNSVFVPGSKPLSNRGVNSYAGSSHAGALLSSLRAEDLCFSLVDDFVIRTKEGFSDSEEDLCLGHHPTWKSSGAGDWEVFLADESNNKDEVCCDAGKGVEVIQPVTECKPAEKCEESVWEGDDEGNGEEFSSEESHAFWESFTNSSDASEGVEVIKPVIECKPAKEWEESVWEDDDDDDEGAGEEFSSEVNQALWESFSKSSDPYNPLSFSACISTSSKKEAAQDGDNSDGLESDSVGSSAEEGQQNTPLKKYCLDFRQPQLESESDWDSSDGSGAEEDDENDKLWELFANPADPYDPLHFTACAISSILKKAAADDHASTGVRPSELDCVPEGSMNTLDSCTGGEESDGPSGSEVEEELWNSFSQSADPYHPLHFRACLRSSPAAPLLTSPSAFEKSFNTVARAPKKNRRSKPALPKRHFKHYCHQTSVDRPRLTTWKKSGSVLAAVVQTEDKAVVKKVRFSPIVQVHTMHTWSFAMQAARKGLWEELARDRVRFQRRIEETEQAIGYCFHPLHRERILDYICNQQNAVPVLNS